MSNLPLTDFDVQGRPKTLAEVKLWMKDRLQKRVHPMNMLDSDEGPLLIDSLTGLDGAAWAAVWLGAGNTVGEQAKRAEASGDTELASALYMKASGLYFLGRFPCPNHPDKERCASLERETYLAASRSWKEPIQRIAIPFAGRAEEGAEVIGYLRKPLGIKSPPLIVMWGGVDAWKEQMTAACNAFLARGVATLALDNAGTGESPVKGVVDAERQFIAALDWAAEQEDLQGDRVALLGRSFGGYWATKLAHTAASKIAAAVNWGGGAHHMFERSWVEASRYPDSYLMELVETRCRMLGANSDEEYIAGFKQLSLLDQGLLDLSSAPLLLVNGKHDRQCPIEDIQLLLEHGSPKSVRLFPGGHMGNTPQTLPTIVDWVVKHLGVTK
ncbi:alpha/beta fold hydrolase [Pseudomonas frederiksbergensis]|uniref:alpha/beta hydrolase family protein n=1 Tax=Pseudomonas frederiksbergensis TaxID=104087 RepID=UPI00197D82D9|nr:alpha/beta fold hydrolase [Pseudomonas frederiksbergensis]MBN3864905.1 alpha/beta fold hydrolase [Pseudomonas frederiksbergensis]